MNSTAAEEPCTAKIVLHKKVLTLSLKSVWVAWLIMYLFLGYMSYSVALVAFIYKKNSNIDYFSPSSLIKTLTFISI